jgi:(R,R)-butanediol dehydrogenase / meso-butanediol dehydrogenase / diacetyl reductase
MKAALYEGNKKFTVKPGSLEPLTAGMVRLKVAYCGVCGTDIHIYHGKMDARVKMPQVIGHEVSGEVVETAPNVTSVKVGDKVAVRPLQIGAAHPSDNGFTHIGKNLKFIGIDTIGGMQTYWNVPAYTLHKLPENLPMELGALIEPLAVACHDVRLSELKSGENVVVLGGGPIGVLIGLVAKYKKAKVLLSEPNTQRLELCQSLGLAVNNPLEQNIIEATEAFTNGAMADIVFEVSGAQAALNSMTQLLKVRGRIVMVAIHSEPKPIDLFKFFWQELKMLGARVYEPEDFEEAIQLAANGELALKSIITQIYPLDEIQQVFEAIDNNPSGLKYLLDCSN